MKPLFLSTPAAFRDWLEKHYDKEQELWVGFHKKRSGKPSITWPEAVDAALCFGWIDGVRKSLGDEYEKQFRARRKAWDFFQAQPSWYQRTTSWWVISAKKEETRLKRLSK